MKDGSIDAMFWSGGLPTRWITDLFVSQRDDGQVHRRDRHPAEAAENQPDLRASSRPAPYLTPADVPTVVVPNLLLVKEDMDGNTACVLTKALFEHKADLVKANKAAEGITLDTAGRPARCRCIPAPRRRPTTSARAAS